MYVAIRALDVEPFPITNEIPEGLSGYHIPGSKILSGIASFGKFMVQIAELGDYNWLYYIFKIEKDVSFLLRYPAPLVLTRVSLKGDFNYTAKPLGNLLIKENQFNIFYLYEPINMLSLTKGEYSLFEAICTENLAVQMLNFFPVFEEFKTNILQSKPSMFFKKEVGLTASILECLYKIIHSPYSENIRQFHVNAVKDLLMMMLKEAFSQQPHNNKFAIDEVERIYAAKAFIDSNIPRHYNIGQIARKAGINEKKLKWAFKEIFGIGLYGYFRNRILEMARIEIEQTKRSIKEIALHAGYKNPNNFSAAFKKKFGVTPLTWREQFNSSMPE